MSPSHPSIAREPDAHPATNGAGNANSAVSEIEAFCREHNLSDYLKLSLQLARDCYKNGEIHCELAEDYGTDDRWVVVYVRADGSIEEALAAGAEYTARWVAAVPWPQRYLIRHSSYFA
jgi:hypothetical protein